MGKYLEDIGINIKDGCVPGGGDISILTDDRANRFRYQIGLYGFDDRETWNLEYTSACWLYEHLMMYKEIGGKTVDLDFYKFDVETVELNKELTKDLYEELKKAEGKFSICDTVYRELTQAQCIDYIIEYLKQYILKDEDESDFDKPVEILILEDIVSIEKVKVAFKIYAEVFPAMWW